MTDNHRPVVPADETFDHHRSVRQRSTEMSATTFGVAGVAMEVVESARKAQAQMQAKGALSGLFHMSGASMHGNYAQLYQQYEVIKQAQSTLKQAAEGIDPSTVAPSVLGVWHAAQAVREHALNELMTQLVKVEQELVTVLNGMHESYAAQRDVDIQSSGQINAAGG